MIYRIIIILLVSLAGYLSYSSINYAYVKFAVHNVKPEYAQGNPDAKLTIVEFLDYSCGKCHDTDPALKTILKNEKDVLFIPRPIFSQTIEGNLAGHFAYAAGRQGKFIEAHNALIETYRPLNDVLIDQIIEELDLDKEQIIEDMKDQKITRQLKKNYSYNRALGSPTIPTFFINNRILWIINIGQVPTATEFQKVIQEAKDSAL